MKALALQKLRKCIMIIIIMFKRWVIKKSNCRHQTPSSFSAVFFNYMAHSHTLLCSS